MSRPSYSQTGKPVAGYTGFSQQIRDEFELIQAGIETMRLVPLIYHVPDPHKGSNYFERFAIPSHPAGLTAVLEKAICVNSAANGASQMSTWLYTSVTTLGAKTFIPSAPAETVIEWDLSIYTEAQRAFIHADSPTGLDAITVQMQGDLVTTMPIVYSFLIKYI